MFFMEFVLVLLMMILGARYGGVFFGMVGGFGLVILMFFFQVSTS